jgi:hypothetical protein
LSERKKSLGDDKGAICDANGEVIAGLVLSHCLSLAERHELKQREGGGGRGGDSLFKKKQPKKSSLMMVP